LTHCGHLILRRISKFDATRCQLSRPKYTKFYFRWGSAPDPSLYLKGPNSKGERGKRERRGGNRKAKGKGSGGSEAYNRPWALR